MESTNGDSLGRLARLTRKELSEILRDRRTIITLVLMPLLLYPLLSVAFQQFFLASNLNPSRPPDFRIGVASENERRILGQILSRGERALFQQHPGLEKIRTPEDRKRVETDVLLVDDLGEAMADSRIDVGIHIPGNLDFPFTPPPGTIQRVQILFIDRNAVSLAAVNYLERRLHALNDDTQFRVMPAVKKQWTTLEPDVGESVPGKRKTALFFALDLVPLARAGEDGLINLAALVPLILILMTITGAVYPAIDLTAGERERGTLEILVAAPVPRMGLLFAKYVTVVVVALLTAVVNLTAMMITLASSGLGRLLVGETGLTLGLILQLLGLLVLFALFFSAVLLSLTSFARSFKEAQAYLIPLMLASLGPGLVGLLPGLKLENFVVVPLVNIVLMARDLFQGQLQTGPALLTIVVTLAYAGAAITLAARTFGAEGVLYNEQNNWSDLLRRPPVSSNRASLPLVFWCLALMIPGHVLMSAALRLLFPVDLEGEPTPEALLPGLLMMPVLALLLFAAMPLLAAGWARVRLVPGFNLHPPGGWAVLAAVLLGVALGPLLLALLAKWFGTAGGQGYEALLRRVRLLRDAYPVLMVAAVVVSAVTEELFFRGVLFRALAAWCRPALTIVIAAVAFGLMHLVMGGPAARLVPSTLMGLVLGLVAWRCGSVWPAMLLHALHNATLESIAQNAAAGRSLPEWTLPACAGSALAGLCLLLLVHPKTQVQAE